MKMNYRINNRFALQPSSKDIFYYFDFKTTDDFRYWNIKNLFKNLDNFDKKSKKWKRENFPLDEKLVQLELEDGPWFNSTTIYYFNKQELFDLLEYLCILSYEKNKKLFKLLKNNIIKKNYPIDTLDNALKEN